MNGYERGIVNRLQMQMSKREAENAIYDIREGLYGDPYIQIHPNRIVGDYGAVSEEWPERRYVIWAYFHNNYSRLKQSLSEDILEEQKKTVPAKQLPPERDNLQQKDGETFKQYNKRFRRENPYNIYNIAPEWHSVSFITKEQGLKFVDFCEQYNIKLDQENIFSYKNGYDSSIRIYTNGLNAVQIFDAAKKEGLGFTINNMVFEGKTEQEENMSQTDKFVQKAFDNAGKIRFGEKSYQDVMLEQRVEGPSNAGSNYPDITTEELKKRILNAQWTETTHESVDASKGFKVYVTKDLPVGSIGICNIQSLPEDTQFYAIDPKHTGKISIGVSNEYKDNYAEKTDTTYLITGPEEINGEKMEVVQTFHPGEPVSPSVITINEVSDGTKLTKQEAIQLGFDKCKFMNEAMVEEYEEKLNQRKDILNENGRFSVGPKELSESIKTRQQNDDTKDKDKTLNKTFRGDAI